MFMTAKRSRTHPGHVTAALWACALVFSGVYLVGGATYGLARPTRPAVAPAPLTRAASVPATAAQTPTISARPIQDIRVGDRVLTRAPEPEPGQGATPGVLPASEPSVDAEEVDPATWRRVDLVMPDGFGGDLEIVLLRPLWWVEAAGARAGGTVDLDLPEMGAVGTARVVSVGPCPPLKPGKGKVVTGTYTHPGATVLNIQIDVLDAPIGVTPLHPFYSMDRRRYVVAGDLKVGETLLTLDGQARVMSVNQRAGTHQVFNLEVHDDHVYRVSAAGVLVHNQSPSGGTGPTFVVTPGGTAVPVPTGVGSGGPTRAGGGTVYTGGSGGGPGNMNPNVTGMRIMPSCPAKGPYPAYPNGYYNYTNAGGQVIDGQTGKTLSPGDPGWHIPF